MFRSLAIVLLFAPAIAIAQTSTPLAPTEPTPAAPRFANDCTHFYPAEAAKVGAQGVTVVSVHATSDGIVQGLRVAETSGNADLDKAALVCMTGAHVSPIKSGGVPIDADTQVQVVWQRSYFGSAPGMIGRGGCSSWLYPPVAVRQRHEGVTTMSFTIAENGTVKNVTVSKSSGYDELDQAAIACVSQWQYRPVTQNGKPVAVDSKAVAVNWRLSH